MKTQKMVMSFLFLIVVLALSTVSQGGDMKEISFGWYSLSFHYSFDPDYTAGMTDAERIARWKAPLVEAAKEGWDYVMVYGPYNYTKYKIDGKAYDLKAYMDVAHELGVKVLVDIGIDGGVPSKEQITKVVNDVKDHPALYGYYIIDEPEMREGKPYFIKPEDCIAAYKHLKSLDPSKLVHMTMSDSMQTKSAYLAAADVLAKELYNEEHWSEIEGDIAACKKAGKPLVIVPRIYIGQGLYARTYPTAEEFQFNVFAPIAMGAFENGGGVIPFLFQGYQGWMIPQPKNKTFREDLCYPTTRILKKITPYLLAGEKTGCTFQWIKSSGANDARFKRIILGDSNGDVILIIANNHKSPSTESFQIKGLDSSIRKAQRLDSPDVIKLKGPGKITNQSFAPKEVKIYKLTSP